MGTIYWPFFSKNPNNFIAIVIGCIPYFLILCLVIVSPQNYRYWAELIVDIWYCIVIVCLLFLYEKVSNI